MSIRRLHTAAVVLIAGVVAVLVGCAIPASPPPAVSAAQYVRPGPDTAGAIDASVGYLYLFGDDVTSDGQFWTVYGEGGATFRLTDSYDLSARTRPDTTTLEGNLRLVDGPVSVGWLHGVGGTVMVDEDLAYHLTTGLFWQVETHGDNRVFGALRAATASLWGETPWLHQYGIATVGYHTQLDMGLSIAPQLQLLYEREEDLTAVAPMVTFSAPW